MDRTAIALSPSPQNLILAARCRDKWDILNTAGSRLIVHVLAGWEDQQIDSVILLVPHVADPARVKRLLAAMGKRGVSVVWVAPKQSKTVVAATTGLKNVTLHMGSGMLDAFAASGLSAPDSEALSEQLESGWSVLTDYCKYQIAMSLISKQDPAPLVAAADLMSKCADKPLTERELTPADRRSVAAFAAADFPYLAGYSPPVMALKDRIRQVGATELNVLVLGETGTGKENVAFYLHEFSQRRAGPLVAINCAGLDAQFLRSELFGHVKGAFTGATGAKRGLVEEAAGGTLFLDEVAEMPLSVQAALLRFLQNGKYVPLGATKEKDADVRIIAATQPDLQDRVATGRFREDLYYRLAEVVLHTPSLRDVQDDLPYLVDHLIFGIAERTPGMAVQTTRKYFGSHVKELRRHQWPGNVRELAALVKRRLLLSDDVVSELQPTPLPGHGVAGPSLPTSISSIRPVKDIVHEYVSEAWSNRGNLTQRELAEKLGKSLNTVKRILGSP